MATLGNLAEERREAELQLIVENVGAVLTDDQIYKLVQALSYGSPSQTYAQFTALIAPEAKRTAAIVDAGFTSQGRSLQTKGGVAMMLAGYTRVVQSGERTVDTEEVTEVLDAFDVEENTMLQVVEDHTSSGFNWGGLAERLLPAIANLLLSRGK